MQTLQLNEPYCDGEYDDVDDRLDDCIRFRNNDEAMQNSFKITSITVNEYPDDDWESDCDVNDDADEPN